MKKLLKNLGLLILLTFAFTLLRHGLESWFGWHDLDYVQGFATGSAYFSIKV